MFVSDIAEVQSIIEQLDFWCRMLVVNAVEYFEYHLGESTMVVYVSPRGCSNRIFPSCTLVEADVQRLHRHIHPHVLPRSPHKQALKCLC